MRQLRPGAGDSGHFFFYLVASLSLFSAAAAAAGSDVKDSFSQPPKDVAVVPTPQETYHAPGYGAIRRRNVVGNVHPRNLNDYELEDFYLVSTVGGMLSARDRKTGKERWNIHTEEGAVQTINHRANSTGDDHDHQTWIVQPSEDGELLFHTQDGLEKSSITVKDIIQSTPYTPHGTDMVYNGSKNTTTYAINARTGVVQRVFSTGGMSGVVNDKKCKTTTKLSDLDDECETNEISDRIIVLGRTEYTIQIHNWQTGEALWTIKLNDWTPNNSDQDLRVQHQRPMDGRYVLTQPDGTIFGFDNADEPGLRSPKYHAMLESPAIRVFDIIKSLSDSASDDLLVLHQPDVPTKKTKEPGQGEKIFVGITEEGGYYALSETDFPLIADQATIAACYQKDKAWKTLPRQEREKSLVGIHTVQYTGPKAYRPSLPAPSNYEDQSSYRNSAPASQDSTSGSHYSWFTGFLISVVFAVVFLGLPKGFRNYYKSVSISPTGITWEHRGLSVAATEQKPDSQAILPVVLEVENAEIPEEDDGLELAIMDVTPQEPDGDAVEKPAAVRFEEPVEENAVAGTVTSSPIENGQAPGETSVGEVPVVPKKKKYSRGRRGGKNKSKGAAAVEKTEKVEDVNNEGEDENIEVVNREQVPADKQSTIISTGVVEETQGNSPFILNNLQIDVRVIGNGSQGTTVHTGRWEGKDCAVKRILTTSADVVMKEVRTLQAVDYHENVVRYYCQQQQGSFLYIALELCPGSLFDVTMKPSLFPDLVKHMDARDTLNQITRGLHHLHTLKIVHRDIKPQNILVGAPNPRSNRPRLLISDFGMCKKLANDEYSFGATTMAGGGTVGWRAPELLHDALAMDEFEDNSRSGTGGVVMIAGSGLGKALKPTKAIDIFALGCVYFFVLTGGDHPFGAKYSRELNITKGNSDLSKLSKWGGSALEAEDIILSMIQQDPKKRPDTGKLSTHPFFWDGEKRLQFLLDVSDRFEAEKDKEKNNKEYRSLYIPRLEGGHNKSTVLTENGWFSQLDSTVQAELVEKKRRGYDHFKILDLLRAIRNKKHHYHDMSEKVREVVGEPPDGYVLYWQNKFPTLMMYTYEVVRDCGLRDEKAFHRKYFTSSW